MNAICVAMSMNNNTQYANYVYVYVCVYYTVYYVEEMRSDKRSERMMIDCVRAGSILFYCATETKAKLMTAACRGK